MSSFDLETTAFSDNEENRLLFQNDELNGYEAANESEQRHTPLPDLLPRDMEEIVALKHAHTHTSSVTRQLASKVEGLPFPSADDEGCDEFEDGTINLEFEFLKDYVPTSYRLKGPSVEGEITLLMENGPLYKIVASDGSWSFYNDHPLCELHMLLRFGLTSDLQPGPGVEIFIREDKIEATCVILPGSTRLLVSGVVQGYKLKVTMQKLSNASRRQLAKEANIPIEEEMRELIQDTRARLGLPLSRLPSNIRHSKPTIALSSSTTPALGSSKNALLPSKKASSLFNEEEDADEDDLDLNLDTDDDEESEGGGGGRKAAGDSGAEEEDEGAILETCVTQLRSYIDVEFPPNESSLIRVATDYKNVLPAAWRRPREYIPLSQLSEVRLFRQEINPSFIGDGAFGNHRIASALSILASQPALVRDLFRHPLSAVQGRLERSVGAYWVTLNVDGWWTPILLDDLLPATFAGPDSVHCPTDPRRLWPGLAEKALAKVRGSYAAAFQLTTLNILKELTGFPIWSFGEVWQQAHMGEGDDELFARLLSYTDSGETGGGKTSYLIVLETPQAERRSHRHHHHHHSNGASSPRDVENGKGIMGGGNSGRKYANNGGRWNTEGNERLCRKAGLLPSHAYLVKRMVYVEELDLRLIQLYNPWGTGKEWDGAWSEEDPKWEAHPEVRDRCFREEKATKEENKLGKFWLEWGDALRMFHNGGVCFTRPMMDYRVRGVFQQGHPNAVLEVHVSSSIEVFFTLSQEIGQDNNYRTGLGEREEYAAILLSVAMTEGNKQHLILSSTSDPFTPSEQLQFNFTKEVAIHCVLEEKNSPYYIIPRIHDGTTSKPYVLGILSDTYIGNGISVNMQELSRSCRVFLNFPTFSLNNAMESTTCEYQIKTTRHPAEEVGEEIYDERVLEFGIQVS